MVEIPKEGMKINQFLDFSIRNHSSVAESLLVERVFFDVKNVDAV